MMKQHDSQNLSFVFIKIGLCSTAHKNKFALHLSEFHFEGLTYTERNHLILILPLHFFQNSLISLLFHYFQRSYVNENVV